MTKEFWKSAGLGGLLIVLLTLVVYIPAMRGGFIWDDDDHLTNNPAMRSVGGLKRIWSSLSVSRYYPLTLTSFWVQYRLWGLNPLPYHVVNVILHAANAALFFFLLRRLRVPGAWAAAALWALHPVCVESVAWVTELKNTQSALFFLLALLVFLRFEDGSRPSDYALALLCGAAAMLSKPSTVMLPGVMLLCAWWRRGGWQRNDWLRTAPFFAFSLGMSALTITEQQRHITAGGQGTTLGLLERLMLAGKCGWFYLGKLVWPVDLSFIYPRWKPDPALLLHWVPLIAVIVTGAALLGFRRHPWARACLLGLGYFGLLLLPVSGLFDIFFFRYSFVADHFQYLACIGPIALVASAGTTVCIRTGQWSRYLGMIAAAVALGILGMATWRQGLIYRDVETLWRDTLAKNPDAEMAHNNLGIVLAGKGKVSEAIAEYRASLRLEPNTTEAHNNLGLALAGQGKVPEAIAEYRASLRLKPDNAEAHNNLGNALFESGKLPEAIAEYVAALRSRPDYAEAHNNLGLALAGQGKASEAIGEFALALRSKPDFVEAHNNLGAVLAGQGKVSRAAGEFEEALRIKPDYAEAHNNLGLALLKSGKTSEAIAEFAAALRIKPDYAEAHSSLGTALFKLVKVPEAIAQYRGALRLKPDLAPALYALAWTLATHGNTNLRDAGEAVQLAERLCAITEYQQAGALDVLAAAYAEAGRFSDAIRVAQKAIELASAAGQQELAQQVQERLKLYQAGRPFHEGSASAAPAS